MTNSALSEERELRRLIFYNFISNLLRCPRFSFAIALTVINLMTYEYPEIRRLNINSFLIDVVFGVAVEASFLNSLMSQGTGEGG